MMMKMPIDRLFIDTNVLLYALRQTSPFFDSANLALTQAKAKGSELWISRQVLRELCVGLLKPQPGFPALPPWPKGALISDKVEVNILVLPVNSMLSFT